MAKKTSNQKASNQKVSFGKRREGKHAKTLNKHASPSSKYRGQGK
jgi:hypothetical protein